MNKLLKMDFKGQTAVLSAILVLVGMMFLGPAITGKALATVHASATGSCGPTNNVRSCEFKWDSQNLEKGKWVSEPTKTGTMVTWSTVGNPQPGDEKGSVTYKIGEDTAALYFDNPVVGSNKCSIGGSILSAGTASDDCKAGSGQNAAFTYNLRSTK